jgi:hypothetical protein
LQLFRLDQFLPILRIDVGIHEITFSMVRRGVIGVRVAALAGRIS